MIYIVRHGQTDWNLEKRCQGHIDIDLNDTGIEQAKQAREKLKGIKFFKVFSSPLRRAFHTAQIITEQDITIDDRLIERDNGLLEGTYNVNWPELSKDPSFEDKYQVEHLSHLQARVNSFFNEIITKYPKKDILIVTHAGVCLNTSYYFSKNIKNSNSDPLKTKNGEILIFNN